MDIKRSSLWKDLQKDELFKIDGGLPGAVQIVIAAVAIWYTCYSVGYNQGVNQRKQEEIDSHKTTETANIDAITSAAPYVA